MVRFRVNELLDERGMTTMEFSKRAGIVYATALGLVRGTTDRIKLETIDKVCAALEVTPGDLFLYDPAKAHTKRERRMKRVE